VKHVSGLLKCIERDADLFFAERLAWRAVKDAGVKLFSPEHGGSYSVFNRRPLSNDIILYCAQDVQLLPRLWSYYRRRITPE